MKCKVRKTNEWFTGHCDLDLEADDMIEDAKTSRDKATFAKVDSIPEEYYAQGQVYMDLYGRSRFRLAYCLVETPAELQLDQERIIFFKLGSPDKDNAMWIEAQAQLAANNDLSEIDPYDRVKIFEFERDEEYLTELKKRVEYARDYYRTLCFGNLPLKKAA
jgi:hypothetical protein